jgi:hypothetical protein
MTAKFTKLCFRQLSTHLLEAAERFYLMAHGWDLNLSRNTWRPPKDYPFKRKDMRSRGHAVNAQKQLTYNPEHGGRRREPELQRIGTK